MSNCIEFVPGYETLVIPASRIDMAKLEGLVAETRDLPSDPREESKVAERIAWWFLPQAEFGESYVSIKLGHGRSIHTNRDFRGLLSILASFMTGSWDARFRITDEYDGHRKVHKIRVFLGPGTYKVEG